MGAVVVGVLVVVAVGIFLLRSEQGVGPSVDVGEWSAQGLLCTSTQRSPLIAVGRGAVLAVDDPAAAVARAECRRTDGEPIELFPTKDLSYFAVGTLRDRIDVSLVGGDAVSRPVRLDAAVSVPADGCGRDAQFRGRLVLLIEGPPDAEPPHVDLREVDVRC